MSIKLSRVSILLVVTSLSLSPTPCGSVEYYVTPTSSPNTDCPQPCYTLDYYALNTTLLSNKENVSLLFLEGRHYLNHDLLVSNSLSVILDIHNHDNKQFKKVDIYCQHNGTKVVFRNITTLRVKNVAIRGISENDLTSMELIVHTALFESVILRRVEICSSTRFNWSKQTQNETLNDWTQNMTRIYNNTKNRWSREQGMNNWTQELFENKFFLSDSEIFDGKISYNPKQNRTFTGAWLELTITNCSFRGTAIDYYQIGPRATVQLVIVNSHIDRVVRIIPAEMENTIIVKISNSQLSALDSALELYTGRRNTNNSVELFISNCYFNGSQDSGVRLFLDTANANWVHATITDSYFNDNLFGVRVDLFMNDFDFNNFLRKKTELNIEIHNTIFKEHQSAIISEFPTYVNVNFNLSINDCIFDGNQKVLQLKRTKNQIQVHPNTIMSITIVVLQNASITSCVPTDYAVITVNDVNMTILDSQFVDNAGTAVDAFFSDVTLAGNTLFHNNSGIKGGALSLHHSFLYISRYSSILFQGNHASKVGGAIYLKRYPQLWPSRNPPCFYQIGTRHVTNSSAVLGVRFVNNSAQRGGDDIYGGSLYSPCTIFDYSPYQSDYITETFPSYKPTTLSSITSDPTRVCLCDDQGTPQCAHMEYIYRELPPRYPGEVFTVPAVVVGYDFGTVPGIVHSDILQNEGDISLARSQYLQQLSSHVKCTDLYFSIQSALTDTKLTLELQASRIGSISDKGQIEFDIKWYKKFNIINKGLLYHPVLLNIILKDCPPGFILSKNQPYSCNCHMHLKDKGVRDCEIINGTGWVFRSGAVWVSASFGENETNNFVINDNCPYDYCNKKEIPVDLRFPDTQCAFNHSGILCGGCYGNLSRALGNSKCLPCDNRYLSLLIVFLFAGLALVFFIKVLDLTVAKGTMNGLIFYANIVWANKSILFPTTETLHPAQQILHTFIAWLNLDLGVETCFFDGLDAYWKTWLQFVFPLYLWTIAGIVITISHYSTRASKIFGNNSVPVLATLILLSYTKLLRTIITSLGFSLLNYPEGTRVVWSFDGNIPYFGAAHSILFLVALATLLLLWLPYTTVLLTLQWLRRKSYLKPLRWINRWKPFFDAYFGQLKPKHHYWVGLLLLVRVVLLVLFAATSAIAPRSNILTIVLSGTILLGYTSLHGAIYRSRLLSLIENSCIMNTVALAAGILYFRKTNRNITIVLYTSITIVFVQFLLVICYHIWLRIREIYESSKKKNSSDDVANTLVQNVGMMVVMAPDLLDSSQYREPLLESD